MAEEEKTSAEARTSAETKTSAVFWIGSEFESERGSGSNLGFDFRKQVGKGQGVGFVLMAESGQTRLCLAFAFLGGLGGSRSGTIDGAGTYQTHGPCFVSEQGHPDRDDPPV